MLDVLRAASNPVVAATFSTFLSLPLPASRCVSWDCIWLRSSVRWMRRGTRGCR